MQRRRLEPVGDPIDKRIEWLTEQRDEDGQRTSKITFNRDIAERIDELLKDKLERPSLVHHSSIIPGSGTGRAMRNIPGSIGRSSGGPDYPWARAVRERLKQLTSDGDNLIIDLPLEFKSLFDFAVETPAQIELPNAPLQVTPRLQGADEVDLIGEAEMELVGPPPEEGPHRIKKADKDVLVQQLPIDSNKSRGDRVPGTTRGGDPFFGKPVFWVEDWSNIFSMYPAITSDKYLDIRAVQPFEQHEYTLNPDMVKRLHNTFEVQSRSRTLLSWRKFLMNNYRPKKYKDVSEIAGKFVRNAGMQAGQPTRQIRLNPQMSSSGGQIWSQTIPAKYIDINMFKQAKDSRVLPFNASYASTIYNRHMIRQNTSWYNKHGMSLEFPDLPILDKLYALDHGFLRHRQRTMTLAPDRTHWIPQLLANQRFENSNYFTLEINMGDAGSQVLVRIFFNRNNGLTIEVMDTQTNNDRTGDDPQFISTSTDSASTDSESGDNIDPDYATSAGTEDSDLDDDEGDMDEGEDDDIDLNSPGSDEETDEDAGALEQVHESDNPSGNDQPRQTNVEMEMSPVLGDLTWYTTAPINNFERVQPARGLQMMEPQPPMNFQPRSSGLTEVRNARLGL